MNTTISNDQVSLTKKDSCVQTITTINDYNPSSLLSIDCADSLVFFRHLYHLHNNRTNIQYTMETTLSESSTKSNHIENVSTDSTELTSSSQIFTNNNSSSHIANVLNKPVKYIPSLDPARQRLSMKLSKIYEREFNKNASELKSHHAESDCLMLLAVLKRYLSDWLEWIELNHQPLSYFTTLPLTTMKKN